MTVSEWLDQFKAQNGRDPSPEEYQEAITNGEVQALGGSVEDRPLSPSTPKNRTQEEWTSTQSIENQNVEPVREPTGELDWRAAMKKMAEEEERKAKERTAAESLVEEESITINDTSTKASKEKTPKVKKKTSKKALDLSSKKTLISLISGLIVFMLALILGAYFLIFASTAKEAKIDTSAFVGNWTIDVMALSNDDDDAIELQAGTVLTIEDKPNLSGILTQNTLINAVEEGSNYDDYVEKLSESKKNDIMSYKEIKAYIKEKTGFTDISAEYYIGNRAAFIVNGGQNMVVFLLPKETPNFYLYKKYEPDVALANVSGTWNVSRDTNGKKYVIDNGMVISVDDQETSSALIPLEEYTEKLQHFNAIKNSDKAILYESILEPILSGAGIEWTEDLKIFVDESRSYVQSSDTDLFIFDSSGQTGYTIHFPLYSVQGTVSTMSKE